MSLVNDTASEGSRSDAAETAGCSAATAEMWVSAALGPVGGSFARVFIMGGSGLWTFTESNRTNSVVDDEAGSESAPSFVPAGLPISDFPVRPTANCARPAVNCEDSTDALPE